MSDAHRIDDLSGRVQRARQISGQREQRIGLRLLRLLARGAPVPVGRLAETLALSVGDVEATLDQWSEVRRDRLGRVTAYMGLSVTEIGEHRLHIDDGRVLSAWCAWDTLFLPELIGESARVTSRCPSTGRSISLTVTPDGVVSLDPPDAVISFLRPPDRFEADVIGSFCCHVHFFASSDAAATWIAGRPGLFELSLDDAYRLARLTNTSTFGDALAI